MMDQFKEIRNSGSITVGEDIFYILRFVDVYEARGERERFAALFLEMIPFVEALKAFRKKTSGQEWPEKPLKPEYKDGKNQLIEVRNDYGKFYLLNKEYYQSQKDKIATTDKILRRMLLAEIQIDLGWLEGYSSQEIKERLRRLQEFKVLSYNLKL